ncbi:MAG: monovalent cation/H+ antiporter complex subunit F [Candidatus Micrarchaeota archaeon]|nr:monovalent cation/H+ antiporter complex subunit F [Candidatus Micrarchaeota archaeon]
MIFIAYAAYALTALALILLYRVAKGPTTADRVLAADAATALISCALALFSVESARAIYFDIALVMASVSFVGTLVIAKYFGEGKL